MSFVLQGKSWCIIFKCLVPKRPNNTEPNYTKAAKILLRQKHFFNFILSISKTANVCVFFFSSNETILICLAISIKYG